MALVDFTTFDDIRAALGVSSDEIEDATLSLDVYEFNLAAELDEMEPSPASSYEAVREKDLDTMTEGELRFYRAVRQFSTYCVAKQLLTSLPMFGPKEISDGKASMVRFSDNPYKETTKRVEAQYEKSMTRLQTALQKLTSGVTVSRAPRTFFLGVGLGTDPVTGS